MHYQKILPRVVYILVSIYIIEGSAS